MDTAKLMELMKNKKSALKQKAKTLKPNPGANRYVLLPGWRKGEEHVWFHDFGQHFIKNSAGEIQAVHVCTDKTYGNPCAICDGLAAAMRSTVDDDMQALLKEAAARQTYLFNVLALDTSESATPQILEVPKSVFTQFVELIEEWGANVFDPSEPQIVTVSRDGKGLNTKYSVQISPKKHAMPAGVFSKLNNLDEYVKQENEEQQRRALTAINRVAGLLPSADVPRTAATTSIGMDAETVSARREAAVAAPTATEVALDDELDAMLGDLTD